MRRKVKVGFVAISKTNSASKIIFTVLQKAIVEGDIAVGRPLRQNEIARSLRTMGIPVREALSRLEDEGLIRTQRFKGSVVNGLSAGEASEIFNQRGLLEAEIFRNAYPEMSEATKQHVIVRCNDFLESADPSSWGGLNGAFHQLLCVDSTQIFTREVAKNAIDQVDRYIRIQLVVCDGVEKAKNKHTAILAAARGDNGDLATALLRERRLVTEASLQDSYSTLS